MFVLIFFESTLCLWFAHLASVSVECQLPIPPTHNLPGYIPPELRKEYRNRNGKNKLHRYEPMLVTVVFSQLTYLEVKSIVPMRSSTALIKEHPSLELAAMLRYSMRTGLQVKPALITALTTRRH